MEALFGLSQRPRRRLTHFLMSDTIRAEEMAQMVRHIFNSSTVKTEASRFLIETSLIYITSCKTAKAKTLSKKQIT